MSQDISLAQHEATAVATNLHMMNVGLAAFVRVLDYQQQCELQHLREIDDANANYDSVIIQPPPSRYTWL